MGAKHNEARQFKLSMDFSEMSFIDALSETKSPPSEALIVVGPSAYTEGLAVSEKYGARIVLVPEGFMKRDQWLVIGSDASAWSEGA